MGHYGEVKQKLKALLIAERELREALERFDDDLDPVLLDADLLDEDSRVSLDAVSSRIPHLERWSGLLRGLRRPGRPQLLDGEVDERQVDVSEYFDRR